MQLKLLKHDQKIKQGTFIYCKTMQSSEEELRSFLCTHTHNDLFHMNKAKRKGYTEYINFCAKVEKK